MITDTKDIEAKDIKRLLLRVYRRFQKGQINDTQAYKETTILNTILKAIEVTDLEQRLKDIENTLKGSQR